MSALEKLARAIADNIQGADPDSCRYAAIAALTALLSPDEGTVEAMEAVHRANRHYGTSDREVFEAAISHMLKEGEGA
jgi:hypothetical protein